MGGEARQVDTLTSDSRGFWSFRGPWAWPPLAYIVLLGKTRKDILIEQRNQKETHSLRGS